MSGNKRGNPVVRNGVSAVQRLKRYEPYWYLIAFSLLVFGILYIDHLVSGATPPRSPVELNILGADVAVYWYGIIIISGVALGTYVVSSLAMRRAKEIFEREVPKKVQKRPLAELKIAADIKKILDKRKVETLGSLLFQWGLHPERLGLNRANAKKLKKTLETVPGVEEQWLEDAPWRIWNPDYAWNGVMVCLVAAVIGARLYHIFTPSPSMADLGIRSFWDYFQQPLELINLRNGGLGIYGGIIGGALGLLWYTHRNRIPTIAWADLGVIGVALGQYIGRWGNFFNQELYGRPTTMPWAVHIDPTYRLTGYEDFETFHPAFLYESIWNLLSFFVLLYIYHRYEKRLKTGDLVALYLVFYGLGRILLEFIRLDSRAWVVGGIEVPVATVVSLAVGLPMAVLLARRHVLKGK